MLLILGWRDLPPLRGAPLTTTSATTTGGNAARRRADQPLRRATHWQSRRRSKAVPLLDLDNRGPGGGTLASRMPTERVNKTQLLFVLVDMNDIETSDPPRHPAARRHLRGPGRKALAAVVLSGVALVIFGGLTLKTLLVIAAAGAIVAAARRYRPKK